MLSWDRNGRTALPISENMISGGDLIHETQRSRTDAADQRIYRRLLQRESFYTHYQRDLICNGPGRAKSDNENGYYIVDAINDAIDTKRKISFRYTDFDVEKQRYIANDGKPYTVSPYTLIWDGDYYYMRGSCDERQEMRNFRLDRIAEQPKILNQIAVMPPEGYTPADYSKHVFRMYDTDEPVSVQLYCHVSVMKYLIDKFGSDFETVVVDNEHFKATVSVCTSTTFYSWVFGFNGKIKIDGPWEVVSTYKEMLQKAIESL